MLDTVSDAMMASTRVMGDQGGSWDTDEAELGKYHRLVTKENTGGDMKSTGWQPQNMAKWGQTTTNQAHEAWSHMCKSVEHLVYGWCHKTCFGQKALEKYWCYNWEMNGH